MTTKILVVVLNMKSNILRLKKENPCLRFCGLRNIFIVFIALYSLKHFRDGRLFFHQSALTLYADDTIIYLSLVKEIHSCQHAAS